MESSPQPEPNTFPAGHSPAFVGGVWMLVLAVFLLLCGFCSSLFYIVLPFASQARAEELQANVVCGSTAGLGLLFGALMAWQGWATVRGRDTVQAARVFPPVLVLVLVFVGAVLLGLGALASPAVAVYAFAPWHFIASALPPLVYVAYAARRLGNRSGLRALTVALGWGALGSTTLAFLLEGVVGAALILALALALASFPGSRALLDQLQAQLRLAQRSQDFTGLSDWLSSPFVMAGLVFYFALIVPPLEEAVKALVVAFIDPRRTRAADALLWGLAAGAGFAIIENMFNAATSLEAWAPVVLLRVGATTMHVANGGMVGRGWFAARVEGRWGSLIAAYVVSVLFHALWNGTALFLGNYTSVLTGSPVDLQALLPVGALGLVLVLLTFAGLAWIVLAVRAVRQAPSVETTIAA